jgi:uncharacterized membrane protein
MRNIKQPGLIIILFLTGLLLLALPLFRPDNAPLFLLFLGRFHPLILHFPIVLIIVVTLLELARRYSSLKIRKNVIKFFLIAAALSTVASIGAGFFLYASGEYSGNLIDQHFWAAAITGFAILATTALYFLYSDNKRYYSFYLAGLIISVTAVGYTSHVGGSVTHGQDYLTEHLLLITSDFKGSGSRSESEMLVYNDMIAPIFEAKCLSCHNAQKSKGDLLMTSYENLLLTGKSGKPSLTAGVLEKSELYNRVVLPAEHEDHMPPEGKTPLTENEIALLKFWIESGATSELTVMEAKKKDSVASVIKQLIPELSRYRMKVEIANLKTEAAKQELNKVAEQLSVSIGRDSINEGNYFTLSMKFPPAPFTNDYFKELKPYNDLFSTVSLTSSGIDDAGLYYISQMTNLKKLYLQKTKLNGSGLLYLQNMKNLEVLNLSFTQVDDKAALDLLKFQNLKEVYLYRTNTSKEVVEALAKYRPDIKILMEEGPYF